MAAGTIAVSGRRGKSDRGQPGSFASAPVSVAYRRLAAAGCMAYAPGRRLSAARRPSRRHVAVVSLALRQLTGRDLPESPGIEILDRLQDLATRIHHEWAIADHGLVQWLASQHQQ